MMSEANNQEFFYNNLTSYLDGEMPSGDLKRFEGMLAENEYKAAPERFSQQKGLLQLHLQRLVLNPRDRRNLLDKIQNQEVAASVEADKINEVATTLARSNIRRSFSLTCLVLGLCYFAYYIFSPPQKHAFKPLDALSYEAVAMDEDATNSKLALPSSNPSELAEFLKKTPGITFAPLTLGQLPNAWQADGAAVIDYEIAKITVVQYSTATNKQKVFLFALGGKLEELPRAEALTQDGVAYRPYASDRMNLIAWQATPTTLGILAGRPSIKELLGMAKGAAAAAP